MSFILDALRKSENERQQDAVPNVTRVPLAPPRQRLPGWAMGVIVVLVVSVLVVSGAWWRSLQHTASQAAADVPRIETQSADRVLAEVTPGGAVAPAAQRRDSPGVAVPLRRLADTGASQTRAEEAAPPAAAPASRQGSVRIAPADTDTRALPSQSELSVRGVSLPRLTLELHSFGTDPAQRYVFINGHKYQEGETLSEGPRLVRVDPDGAVLSYQGSDFRLARE